MKEAKFYDEIAEGPQQAKAYWMDTDDNVRVRVGTYHAMGESHGTILLMLGRFGYVERYGRVAKLFADRGFSTAVVDWRSQGLSDRMAADPQAGHISDFSDYQRDVDAMMKAVEWLDMPKPYVLVGISMGACIGLRSLLRPMFGSSWGRAVARREDGSSPPSRQRRRRPSCAIAGRASNRAARPAIGCTRVPRSRTG